MKHDDGSITLACTPVDDVVDYGFKMKIVRANAFALYKITPVTRTPGGSIDDSSIEQCTVRITQKFELGGLIPIPILNAQVPSVLSVLVDLRQKFEKDDAIDAERRAKLALVMSAADANGNVDHGGQEEDGESGGDHKAGEPYSEHEEALIAKVKKKFVDLENAGGLKPFDSLDMFAKVEAAFEEGSPHIIGRSETIVDASFTDVAAFDFLPNSSFRREGFFSSKKQPCKFSEIYSLNQHYQIFHAVRDFLIPGFQPREFKGQMIWRKEGAGVIGKYQQQTQPRISPSNPPIPKT